MITSNVILRTFFLKFGASTATGFTLDHDGRQYFVTARHVCPDIGSGDIVSIRKENTWVDFPIELVGAGDPNELSADITVLAFDKQISPSLSMPATAAGLTWGQDVYFLGYPYGLHSDAFTSDGYPIPLIKRALMSGSTGATADSFLLDGHNNSGFSGGPAVFRPVGQAAGDYRVFGVISGYKSTTSPIKFQGKETGLSSEENTGIIVCSSIKQVTDLIEQNPIGPELTY